jgi:hypothetical protein
MTFYKIHNKSNGQDLTYPSVGLWTSNDIQEAREIRDALKGYLYGYVLCDNIVIINTETGDEIF